MEDEFEFDGSEQQGQMPPQEEGFENLAEAEEEPVVQPSPPVPETTMPRRASSDAHMPIPTPSEATNKWKVENEKKIKQRDAEFTKVKQDMLKKAEQTLEKIRSERAQLIAKNAKANREAQAKAQAAAATKSSPTDPVKWQKVGQLVDLEKDTTDKERMRAILKAKVAEAKA